MATVPAGVIFPMPGTAAVPAGYVRETDLDGRHPKGAAAGADPGTPGGADTHTHTGGTHSHTVAAHTHTGATSGASAATATNITGGGTSVASATHTHTWPTSGSIATTLAAGGGAFAYSNNDPAYYTVRWIRSTGTPAGVPPGGWAYWDAAALPASWSSPAAARTKYLKGAAAGINGGDTGGSSSTHTHTPAAHQHAFASHVHPAVTSGAPSATLSVFPYAILGYASSGTHTHPVSFTAAPVESSASASGGATGATVTESPYTTLGVIQNDNAGFAFPLGVIGLWLQLRSALPRSLVLCDGTGGTIDTRGKYVKNADIAAGAFTGLGTTGGVATHDHTDPASHTHTATHTHGVVFAAVADSSIVVVLPSGGNSVVGQHTHTAAASGSAGGTSGSGVEAVDAVAAEPSHRQVLWVKYKGQVDVTITAPTADQAVSSRPITLTWTLSAGTQVDRRVILYANDQTTVLHDSGLLTDATMSYTIPQTVQLSNLTSYYATVDVTNNATSPGLSTVHFTTAWTLPATLGGFTATPIGGS